MGAYKISGRLGAVLLIAGQGQLCASQHQLAPESNGGQPDTYFFRIVGGYGPPSGKLCPCTSNCGAFHTQCPGNVRDEMLLDWQMCAEDLQKTPNVEVDDDGNVGLPTQVDQHRRLQDTLQCPGPDVGDKGNCQDYLNCLYDCIKASTSEKEMRDAPCYNSLNAAFDAAGFDLGVEHEVTQFLDCGASVIGCDPPSKFRHWDLVLFFLLLLLSFIVLCMYKGWFIPAIKKCVACMQWTKARASGSKAAHRESMYDEISETHVSAGGSSSEPIDDETI